MAHFAKLDTSNVVTQVIVVSDNDCLDGDGNENETVGAAFCAKLFGGTWKQTSYNNNKRVRYAGIGYTYNSTLDAFIAPKIYNSWTLDANSSTTVTYASWIPPVQIPDDNNTSNSSHMIKYSWVEANTSWAQYTMTV